MKKLFALVLSLALVVAFAVPALATGWASLDKAPVYKDLGIAVYGLETVANTSKVGKLYEELKASYPLVKGTKVHFLVELTVPYGKLSPAVKSLIANKGLDVEIALSNLSVTEWDTQAATASTLSADKDAITCTFTNPDYATSTIVWSWEVWAQADSADEGKVVATAGFYNKWDGKEMKIYDADGDYVYYVEYIDNGFVVESVLSTKGKVWFPVDGSQIDAKGITVDDKYLITYGGQNKDVLDFYNKETDTWASASTSTYNAVKAVYEKVFGFLGFSFAECDYMTKAHYTKFFGTIGEISASYTWSAGSVVVAPVSPELPQTGDNASIVGFAMIVVAMVAAAVVTVKKVRA